MSNITLVTYHCFKAKRKRKMEAQKKETTKTLVRKSEFSKQVRRPPLVKSNVAKLNAKEKRNPPVFSMQPKDQWDSNSYGGSSCYMSCSEDEASVNLLASDENSKENKKKSQQRGNSKVTKEPPTQLDVDDFETQLSNNDEDDDDMLEQELKEHEARRKIDKEVVQSMMNRIAGYPGGEEPEDVLEPSPAQPEMGMVCVWCAEELCQWVKIEFHFGKYYRYQVDTLGSHLPPHNIMRK
jgi:hypothetical protein